LSSHNTAAGSPDLDPAARPEHVERAEQVNGQPARVVAQHRGRYIVRHAGGEQVAVLAGRLRHQAADPEALPTVGDWVTLGGSRPEGPAIITAVLPRRSAFRRKEAGGRTRVQVVAANVDVALIVSALPTPPNQRRLERYVTLAWESGAIPVIVLSKSDLVDDLSAVSAAAHAAAPGVDVVAVSTVTGAGLDHLGALLRAEETAVLLGPSGAGKSTLANQLLGEARLATGAVRGDGKGRHTTTHRELVRLATGAFLIDTPGLRELQLWAADDGLEAAFADVDEFAARCRFGDCAHDTEPGCAVRRAIEAGELEARRLEHWRDLRRELAHLHRRVDEQAATAYRAYAKAMQRALRTHLRGKYGGHP
jgi:ribosome biogenesis GTPase / thiamine phosphate phosphatase